MRRKSRQIRSRDFSNFAKISFEAFLIDNLKNGFFYPQLNWRVKNYSFALISAVKVTFFEENPQLYPEVLCSENHFFFG